MIKKVLWVGVALLLFGAVSVSSARADEWNRKTTLTFSQPVEIPGLVLPAGTYIFKLVDSISDRHIVQVFAQDGTEILATIMTIPDYRLKVSEDTVIRFREVPAGSPEAIRAWFYPGSTLGNEFVYPKVRAAQLARASKAVVPAYAVDVNGVANLKTAPLVAITPNEEAIELSSAIQMSLPPTDSSSAGTMGTQPYATDGPMLPATASTLPLVVLSGFAALVLASGLLLVGKRSSPTVR